MQYRNFRSDVWIFVIFLQWAYDGILTALSLKLKSTIDKAWFLSSMLNSLAPISTLFKYYVTLGPLSMNWFKMTVYRIMNTHIFKLWAFQRFYFQLVCSGIHDPHHDRLVFTVYGILVGRVIADAKSIDVHFYICLIN